MDEWTRAADASSCESGVHVRTCRCTPLLTCVRSHLMDPESSCSSTQRLQHPAAPAPSGSSTQPLQHQPLQHPAAGLTRVGSSSLRAICRHFAASGVSRGAFQPHLYAPREAKTAPAVLASISPPHSGPFSILGRGNSSMHRKWRRTP